MADNLKKIFLSSLLTAVLMLPYLGSFSHLFQDHEHKTCEIYETHLHELDLDCDILEYQFAPNVQILTDIYCSNFYASKDLSTAPNFLKIFARRFGEIFALFKSPL